MEAQAKLVSGALLIGYHAQPAKAVSGEASHEGAQGWLHTLTTEMRDGQDEAWSEFHRRYYLPLLRYAASRNFSMDEAMDTMQQAYLRIARHIKPFVDETEFWRWLTCLVRCAAYDHARGIARRAILLERFAHWQDIRRAVAQPAAPAPGESLAAAALENLPVEDAQLIRMKYYDGWSVEQIAQRLGTTAKAVENRLGRARERMRKLIIGMK